MAIVKAAKARVDARHAEVQPSKAELKRQAKAKAAEVAKVATPEALGEQLAAERTETGTAMPKLPRMPRAGGTRTRKPKPEVPCACGCGTLCKATWAPGHDARARAWAIRIERNVCKMEDVPANERQGAALLLAERAKTPEANIKLVKATEAEKAS